MADQAITVTPLGTGGYISTPNRETATIFVRGANTGILFDAGTGISRFLDPKTAKLLDGLSELNLLLSHYHLDHTIGITWLLKVWKLPLRIFAPTRPFIDVSHHDALARLTESPLFGLPLSRFPFPVEIIPIDTPNSFVVGDLEIETIAQVHGDCGSVGFRIGRYFAYITDTDPTEAHSHFLAGVRLAFMDAMYDTKDYESLQQPDHGSGSGVATVAKKAAVKDLGLIHINPSYDSGRCSSLLKEAKRLFPATTIPDDCRQIKLK